MLRVQGRKLVQIAEATEYGNKASHRYAEILICQECSSPFVAMSLYWNGNLRVKYIYNIYMQHGKDVCAFHRIHEEWIDQQVKTLLGEKGEKSFTELKKLIEIQKIWALREPILDAHIFACVCLRYREKSKH